MHPPKFGGVSFAFDAHVLFVLFGVIFRYVIYVVSSHVFILCHVLLVYVVSLGHVVVLFWP